MIAPPDPGPTPAVGPVLHARGADGDACRLAAVTLTAPGASPPPLRPMGGDPVAATRIATLGDRDVHRHDFRLPASDGAHYAFGDERRPVVTRLDADLRIAFNSCNGAERGDGARDPGERDRMWQRLGDEHAREPFALLLHGGDQLYADEIVGSHPELAAWAESELDERHGFAFGEDARAAAETWLVDRYAALHSAPAVAPVLASVPSLMMWDDHDIFDGWGSQPPAILDSPVGRGLFELARRCFLAFQRGLSPDEPPWRDAPTLSWAVGFPGVEVVAPDLRSERRPERVLGADGWRWLESRLAEPAPGGRRLLVSSVPLLGPRLSLLERVIGVVPRLAHYEDDLRDQWQSRAHRDEWRRALAAIDASAAAGTDTVVLSGEIHLATRAEMPLADGRTLHQLVASGIAHPEPPTAFARGLGLLASLGDDPLPGRPIRVRRIPGQGRAYVAERNYLVLERADGAWSAAWELERSGRSPALSI